MITVEAWLLWSAVVAGAVAFLLLGFVHWAVGALAGGRAPRLVCYVVGLGCVVVVYGVWAMVQVGRVQALVSWAVLCWISLCAGLGTVAGWVLDGVQARRVVEGVRRGQQRAAADRDRGV